MSGAIVVKDIEARAMRSRAIPREHYREIAAGGFSRRDGTVQFYTRVEALLEPQMTVLDFGAGRGILADAPPVMRRLANLKGKVARVIGLDVNPAVAQNPFLDSGLVYDGGAFPLENESVDLVVSDHTFEHICDAEHVACEIHRVLRGGGWLCARTPYFASLHAIASRLVGNKNQVSALAFVQPGRKDIDIFPTAYRMNSGRALRKLFPANKWFDASYTWTPEPTYFGASTALFQVLRIYYALKEPLFGEVLMVFLRKR